MIIKKIMEMSETTTEEKFQLIFDEKDEGWELTREEMEKLKNMTERSLEDFYGRREKETISLEQHDKNMRALEREVKSRTAQLKLTLSERDHIRERIDTLAAFVMKNIPGEPSRNEGVIDTVIRLLEDKYRPKESTENLTKTEEKEPKPREKEQRLKPQTSRDYSIYIDMLVNDEEPAEIRKLMMKDFGITEGTANTYYYNKVRPEAELIKAAKEEHVKPLREVEKEKKALEKELEAKVERKYFSDEDRERIRRQLGLK